MKSLAAAVLFVAAPLFAIEPVIDVYVSTGDNHFLGSSLPIDSPASIESTFDLFKNVNHARRVYWRGLEASCWLQTMIARPENPRYHSFWEWLVELYRTTSPDTLAVKAAHSRGMEIWGMGTLWDWGAPADTPGFGDYPFTFESRLRLAHPEWAPVDKYGDRHQGGPIELAYPEARKALVDLIVQETVKAGYDGISLLTYVENFSQRFQDEFGYSDPIVADFKRQHQLDLRREPFRRGASREDWMRLRGSYVTAFLRELKAALNSHHVRLGMVINSNEPRLPQSWNVPELMITAGSHHMDIDAWVREGLVDDLLVYGNNSLTSQVRTLEELEFLTRGTKTSVSILTSGPFRESWKPFQDRRMATVLAISDDAQHLDRGFVAEQNAGALRSDDPFVRMRVLAQNIGGTQPLDAAAITERASSPNLIERRLALQALGKANAQDPAPLLAGLRDPENCVRCMAALALGEHRNPAACATLLDAATQHGNHMLRECIVIALRRLHPVPATDLAEAALHGASKETREVAMRALIVHARADLLPVFHAGLQDEHRFVRFAAAEALGNLAKNADAIDLLIATLGHPDVAVANRAAVSLARHAAFEPKRDAALAALLARFKTAPDDGWSFRPIGNAILDFGDEGLAALHAVRDGSDPRLAELAWRVADLSQRLSTFSGVTPEHDKTAHALKPGRHLDLHVDPKNGRDSNDGRTQPVKTIARALRLAQPGDTVHLTPGRYLESADFTKKHGSPGKPITLDGHGAVLDGSEPIKADDWEALGNDLYRKVHLLPRFDDAMRGRWFFLWNGRMNRMGLCSKGPSLPLKMPAELEPDEWTYVKDEDAFYLKLRAGQSLADANIRYPARSSGVIQSIAGSWQVVRNVITTHVYNDGYNVHGQQRGLTYENIAAIECGDDGFSAHDEAECRIDGFISIGNATGLCDTVSSVTSYRNVFISGCHGYDIFFIGDSPHRMENVFVESAAARALEISQHTNRRQSGPSLATLKNVHFRRTVSTPGEARISRNGKLTLDHCTFENVNFTLTPGGEIQVRESLIRGEPKPAVLLYPNVLWQGRGNCYDLATLRFGNTSYTAANFADFQKITASETDSTWSSATPAPNLGARDLDALTQRAQSILKQWQEAR